MDLVGLMLGLVGIAVSVAIAVWQHGKAQAAERNLANVLSSMPNALLSGVTKALSSMPTSDQDDKRLVDSARGFQTRYADIDGDGDDELLVEVATGAYAAVLLVYGRKEGEFRKIGELYSTNMGGFEIADVDGDGRLEIRTDEIAARPGLPYVAGLRDEVFYRFESGAFVELRRNECFTEQEMRERQAQFAR